MVSATPLTEAEKADFQRLFHQRLAKVQPKTAEVFAFRPMAEPPFLVNSALYTAFGSDPAQFPLEYYDDPAVMTAYQERIYYEQVSAIEDDFVPYLMPWFGTGVAASALGSCIEFHPGLDPAVDPTFYPVATPEDIRRLQIPDPEKDGLMPRVLAFQRYMKEHSFLPVGITDFQGPLTTANQLMGYDKLIYLMQDNPAAVHELMEKITETLIRWVKAQKEVIGEPLNECFGDQQVYVGKNAGIWFSDDDCVLMSPKTYREFVVPYNARILQEFGGGILHYCGNGTHQAENFLQTEGLRGLNIYNLYNLRSLAELKQKAEGRLVIFACDFTPVHYPAYFDELVSSLSFNGLIIDSQFSPVVGLLEGGKYVPVQRDLITERQRVYAYLRQLLQERQKV